MRWLKQFIWISLFALFASQSTQAAKIKWGGGLDISGEEDILSFLPVEQAWNFGGKSNITFAGVTFAISPDSKGRPTYDGFQPSSPSPSVAPEYREILGTGYYAETEIVIKNLKPGQTYTVQVWSNDTRDYVALKTRRTVFSSPGGKDTVLKQSSDDALSLGQFALGVFTADSTNQVIEVYGTEKGEILDSAQVINALVLYKGSVMD